MDISVCSAILNFNSGSTAIMKVLEMCGVSGGYFTKLFCQKRDRKRLPNMKSTEEAKTKRERLNATRKGYTDKNIEKEGLMYGAGEQHLTLKDI